MIGFVFLFAYSAIGIYIWHQGVKMGLIKPQNTVTALWGSVLGWPVIAAVFAAFWFRTWITIIDRDIRVKSGQYTKLTPKEEETKASIDAFQKELEDLQT